MNTKMFLFQIIVASIANIIAGIILSERKEGNKPSSKSLVTINFETNNFNIHPLEFEGDSCHLANDTICDGSCAT